jgi:LmbE family N-acetylglucosaminyl deacetylase
MSESRTGRAIRNRADGKSSGAEHTSCDGHVLSRRTFLRSSAAVAGGSAFAVLGLGSVSAAETRGPKGHQNPKGSTLITMAHADDHLLFMSPDVYSLVTAGGSVRVVCLTTGDAGKGQPYWEMREQGTQAGGAYMASMADQWKSKTLDLPGHSLPMFTLKKDPDISLVFMRLPDGGVDGDGYADTNDESLMKLWTGAIPTVQSADGDVYTTSELVSTLAKIISKYAPDNVFTQNFDGTYGNGDHTDHITTGFLTQAAAQALSPIPFNVYGYQGYPVSSMPANVSGAQLTAKQNAFEAYAQYDEDACSPISECYSPGLFEDTYGTWLPRQYQVAEITAGT